MPADELRESMERRVDPRAESAPQPLRLDLDGIALLDQRLIEANVANPQAMAQLEQLRDTLHTVLDGLRETYGDQIEVVAAVGDWATHGVDLRNAPWEELLLEIVLRSDERPFTLYRQIAEDVFADPPGGGLFLQFTLLTRPEWQHARAVAERLERDALARGIPLLVRA